ncbi:phosphatidylinositol 4-phosphate 5-kinase 5-like [Magnolia sinica]|uniref:phosphatidylinositol 4-phosphate 5-kinase 5-like n=1 Tax=Magnolia sinica TaxID=86752 RepID=UPI00265ACD6B|nr:phosphatidylinositol 4-phosphate 5-kinase 5-like [Magnolia sinica]
MESQSKLTRTSSSLLRSPTVRTSVHSLAALDEESQKKTHKPDSRIGALNRFLPLLAVVFLPAFFFFYLREEIPTSANLFLASVFLSVTAFAAAKKGFSIKNSLMPSRVFRNFWEERSRKMRLQKGGSIQWSIGSDDVRGSLKKERKKIVREGVEFYSNGDFYEGEFHKGRSNGSGVYNYFVNGRYEGDWVDGRYDGYGIESWARGSRYRGQYRKGLRHGFGVYRFYTGDSYAGEWFNGQSHGVGVQTCSDGSSYVGEFKCGVKHGFGCYHFRNGDRYAGEYFSDKIHGFGVYHFANGHCYEGSWHEGRKQGFGMYTFRNGDGRCGEWDCGVLKNPQLPSSNAVLHAVQSARKAAENAIRLPRVDERVNKAVMASNRAATAARVAAIKAVQNRIDGNLCEMDV